MIQQIVELLGGLPLLLFLDPVSTWSSSSLSWPASSFFNLDACAEAVV